MHLTQFSDYAMRTVLYLASRGDGDRLASVEEISRAYRISRHHLVRVAQTLTELGIVTAQRGRGGGLKLAKAPSEVNVGWLVRRTEPNFHIVECFRPETNTCPIASACGLKGALIRAREAFLAVLDEYTLEQFLTTRSEMVALFDAALKAEPPTPTEPEAESKPEAD
ncbi:RrF2 family transcriptional regulator [Paludisphaera soli]|uniref:RrF2 family transcriptional regulator n=1 Tax=Paludisphaera soli TaxID=2712865 RepID=UPI0013EE3B01|nr:Rrf2 family transcriptional regulator [Paludisphaera soli]